MSKAKLDFPEPDNPVMTTNLFLGITTSIFFKLCNLAPLIMMFSFGLRSRMLVLIGALENKKVQR